MATEFLVVKNRANSKIILFLAIGGLTLDVPVGEGANFPATYPFHITIEEEILEVTNVTVDTLTVTRAAQSTSAAAHPNKSHVYLNITAKSVTDLNSAVNAIEDGYLLADGSRAATYITLTPGIQPTAVEGSAYYNAADNHVYIATE